MGSTEPSASAAPGSRHCLFSAPLPPLRRGPRGAGREEGPAGEGRRRRRRTLPDDAVLALRELLQQRLALLAGDGADGLRGFVADLNGRGFVGDGKILRPGCCKISTETCAAVHSLRGRGAGGRAMAWRVGSCRISSRTSRDDLSWICPST